MFIYGCYSRSSSFPKKSGAWEPGVGRNKPVCALSAGQVFPAFLRIEMPETPALAIAGRAYSGLLLRALLGKLLPRALASEHRKLRVLRVLRGEF